MTERIKAEEEGKVDPAEANASEERSSGQQGLLLRELVREYGKDDDYSFLADACLNFLTAGKQPKVESAPMSNSLSGKDTTAQALAWTIYEVLRAPMILANLQQEIDNVGNDVTASESVAMDGPLQYMNAVIQESLRLHPPVPLEIHENIDTQAVALADGSVVHPGEIVLWSPWAMGRSTRIWGEDAAHFKPSRWFPEVQPQGSDISHPTKKTAFEFPVFHAGPRSCLGKNLAKIELSYALLQIIRRYDMVPTWPLNREKEVGTALTGPILGGLRIRARRRSSM